MKKRRPIKRKPVQGDPLRHKQGSDNQTAPVPDTPKPAAPNPAAPQQPEESPRSKTISVGSGGAFDATEAIRDERDGNEDNDGLREK